jgi:hypothetical protein
MDASEDVAVPCFEAEVFHADARQDVGRVQIVVEKFAQVGMAEVRVMSSALIDEPVVTLNLRYRCGQMIGHRYVLLADLPLQATEAFGSPALASSIPAASAMPSVLTPLIADSASLLPMASAQSSASSLAPVRNKPVATRKSNAARLIETPRPAARSRDLPPAKRLATDKADKPARSVGVSRLKLDPLEMLSDRIANLDSTMSFAPSEDALLNLQKMKVLEGEVKALRDSAVKSERSLAELKVRLQQAETERFPAMLIYGLGALVLLCLLAVAWFWSRQRRGWAAGDQWWSDAGVNEVALDAAEVREANHRATAHHQSADLAREAAALHAGAGDAGHSSGLEAHSIQLTDSAFSDFRQSGQVDSGRPGLTESPAAAGSSVKLVRSLNSTEILEVRRQAEKLVSLGIPEQAMAILKRQISESDEPNPVVYLDLISLLHELDMKSDYQQFSQDFSLLFNGRMPEFASFEDEGQSLESHPEALSSITAAWPTPKVLELIEAYIYRDPWAVRSEPFDLAAMRDLLLLYAVAQSILLAGDTGNDDHVRDHLPALDAPESQPAQLDYADSVASSFPALSKSALADLFGPAKELPQVLDLDLSELRQQSASARVVPATDIDLSQLIPHDRENQHGDEVETDVPAIRTAPGSQHQRSR